MPRSLFLPRKMVLSFSLLATMTDLHVIQSGLFYQKQRQIFIGKKRLLGIKLKGKDLRYVKEVGLGIKTPKNAIEGTFIDKKCPWTGDVSIRGRVLRGIVVSAGRMKRTVVIRRDYLHYIKKYRRFEKRHSNISAHCSPAIELKEGDTVTVGECRPLSKTVRFNVLKVHGNKRGVAKVFSSF